MKTNEMKTNEQEEAQRLAAVEPPPLPENIVVRKGSWFMAVLALLAPILVILLMLLEAFFHGVE